MRTSSVVAEFIQKEKDKEKDILMDNPVLDVTPVVNNKKKVTELRNNPSVDEYIQKVKKDQETQKRIDKQNETDLFFKKTPAIKEVAGKKISPLEKAYRSSGKTAQEFMKQIETKGNTKNDSKNSIHASIHASIDDAITAKGDGKLVNPGQFLRRKMSALKGMFNLTFSIDAATKSIIKSISRKEGISMSDIIRRAIWCYLTIRTQYKE